MSRLALVVLIAACSDPAARVQLAPVSPCGTVASKTALRVVAYTATGEIRRTVPLDEDRADIDAFPADTEQLGVEVIGDNGRLVAVGKSAPLELGALEDGTRIPIVMAPVDGICEVGPMTEARRSPAVARAGSVVLVVGGRGPGGELLATAEVYDTATATFTAIEVPPSLQDPDNGLAGAVLSELPDGRVALSGTSSHALTIFDPSTRRFSAPVLFDHRAFHGAFGVTSDRLLVIGGCAEVVGGTCAGPSLRTGFVYDLLDVTQRERGPALASTAVRAGARVLDVGEQRDGSRQFVLAGGFGDADIGDRFSLGDATAEAIAGLGSHATVLDGGAVLSVGTQTTVLPPDALPVSSATAPADGAMVTLEDGSVLVAGAGLPRWSPTSGQWRTMGGSVVGTPSALRLADGSVLLLGGDATTDAAIFRPSLIGPATGSLVVVPDGSADAELTAPDPRRLDRSGGNLALVTEDDDLSARILVGGPRMTQGSINAVVRVSTGGVALIAQQTGPGRLLEGRLVPGEKAALVQVAGGQETVLCRGATVSAADLTQVQLSIAGAMATLAVGPVGGETVAVRCEIPTSVRGQWGLAAAGVGARVELGPVTVTRTR